MLSSSRKQLTSSSITLLWKSCFKCMSHTLQFVWHLLFIQCSAIVNGIKCVYVSHLPSASSLSHWLSTLGFCLPIFLEITPGRPGP